ncbi:artemin isoform X1 [Takifugu flavidus]|uniref:artemin isoform X1 n=1 Tax=Takifugu flavidus TaxID=433684 RepID=UPI00254478DD|nr:artemin isoform X1 [Takifugu flavidus]
MIGKPNKRAKEGNTWWRPDALTPQHHLRRWKVMLWVLASLLTLVEYVFSEEDSKESDPQQPPWSPTEDSNTHTPWHKVVEYWPLVQEEEVQSRWQRAAHDAASTKTWKRKRQRSRSSRDCHLERRQMRVRDLGLGYDSDEIILFKYCVGTCLSSRKNYDLALKALMENRSISSKNVSGQPCCRPVRYEAVSFMDAQTTWQTIKWLSASNCSCVG